MNPCRCGQADEPGYACHRAPNARCVAQYQGRLSGPLLDRFDLTIDVPSVSAADLLRPAPAEGSAEVAAAGSRGAADPERPLSRARARSGRLQCGGAGSVVEAVAAPEPAAISLLRDAAERMRLSARGYHRVLKLARTLADLDGGGAVRRAHLAEALSYRGAQERAAAAA